MRDCGLCGDFGLHAVFCSTCYNLCCAYIPYANIAPHASYDFA